MEPSHENIASTALNSAMPTPTVTSKDNIAGQAPTTSDIDTSAIGQATADDGHGTEDASVRGPPAFTDVNTSEHEPSANRDSSNDFREQVAAASRAIEELNAGSPDLTGTSTVDPAEQRKLLEQFMGDKLVSKPAKELYASHADPEGASLHQLAIDSPHPDAAEIIRQVEFYFSDESLPHDAHLLSFTGAQGTGWVSLNRIFGFKKMKTFKPPAKAKDALKGSTFLEIDDKNKHVRRRIPLAVAAQCAPKESQESKQAKVLIEKPWLSKALLKPTGFEVGFTEGPLRPEEYAAERKLYDPDESSTIRMDYAVAKYMLKRKMHQQTLHIFSKFLLFGGFDGSPRQFTGGFDEKDLEGYSKDEIMQMRASFCVASFAYDGLVEDQPGGATWTVDFEGMAKAFFSSHLLQHFDWKDQTVTDSATNIVRNFYNYLQYHDVCPEYRQDILNAQKVCDLAEQELPKLAAAGAALPGDFNTACSTLFDGYYASRRPFNPNAEWVNPEDDMGWSDNDAWAIWHTAILAHCTQEQCMQFQQADLDNSLAIVDKHETGLEVVGVEFATGKAKGIYESDGIKESIVRPTGKLICNRWKVPGAPGLDIPKEITASREASMPKRYEFLVEDDVLKTCHVGMKMEAIVYTFNVADVKFIDRVLFVYPSFFYWTLNERIRDIMPAGPPKEWMKRQNSRHSEDGAEVVEAEGDGMEVVEHESEPVNGKDNTAADETVD